MVKDFWAVPEYAELLTQINNRVYPFIVGGEGTAKEALDATRRGLERDLQEIRTRQVATTSSRAGGVSPPPACCNQTRTSGRTFWQRQSMATARSRFARGGARMERSHHPQPVHHPDDPLPDRLQHLSADLFARLFVHRLPRLAQRAGEFRRPAELPRAAGRPVSSGTISRSPRKYVIVSVGGQMIVGFGLALLLNRAVPAQGPGHDAAAAADDDVGGGRRACSGSCSTIPSWGTINYALGLGNFAWLSNPDVALYAVAHHRHLDVGAVRDAAVARRPVGRAASTSTRRRRSIAPARWYTFTRITLPLVAPLLLIALIFRTMEAFKTFDLAFIMTTPADDRADRDQALQVRVPGMADRQVLRARLHRADHGARDHQHLREVSQQGEGALRWPPSTRRARSV